MQRWTTNMLEVEIEITSFCNLACFNCNRSIRQAPTKDCMKVMQVEKFITESIALGWRWRQITLIGGEPTLHEQFWEILRRLKRYKDRYPDCVIEVSTNGYGEKVRSVLERLPVWAQVDNSLKTSNEQTFDSFNVAPIDIEELKHEDFSAGCWITNQCGIGLTKNGYYPCGPGGSLDRVFGFDIGIRELSALTPESIREQLSILCQYCGHFKSNYSSELINEEVMSTSWQEAYANFKIKRPPMTEY